MSSKASVRVTFAAAFCAALLGLAGAALADDSAPAAQPATPAVAPAATPPAAATPAPATPPAAATPAPATPATPPAAATPAPATPAPATPPAATPAPATPAPSSDSSDTQTIQLAAHPAAYIEGKATWEDGFKTIMGDFTQIRAELAKAGLKPAGHPIAVFTETDDTSFAFQAMVPIDAAPAGKSELTDAVKFGETPAGKAMKFEHRGSYEDIDSTYEAITAYLDEKGLEAQNLFYEEYLNDVKTPDNPTLEVDIYVLLK